MAIVRYCILETVMYTCTEVVSWDNTYTYYPPSGNIIAGDNTGEVGWMYSNGSSPGGTWTPNGSAPSPGSDADAANDPSILKPFSDWDGGIATTTFFDLTLDLGDAFP